MKLIHYLNDHFYTLEQLLSLTGIGRKQYDQLQAQQVVPDCSYSLKVDIQCHSFFGEEIQLHSIDYFAKGNTSWIGTVLALSKPKAAQRVFKERYQDTLTALKNSGFTTTANKLNAGLDEHIESEWLYFLDGTYGLCTKNGLPEQIAQKELAICLVEELTSYDNVDSSKLASAVNLLDQVTAPFAPHERQQSSRHRLIEQVRHQFQIAPSVHNQQQALVGNHLT